MEKNTRRNQTIPAAELLAPGGSFEGMRAAINAGADAVYMGGTRFGARAYAQNPDEDMLLEAIDYCHLHGRKLYLTVNTLLKEEELEEQLYSYLRPYYERGLDAVLVQDLGTAAFIREAFPQLPLHASTQMSVQSVQGALLAKQLGFERIVPARELSLKEIAAIYDASGMQVECFIHGALCYSYSGQCLLSSLIGGRSGNRGRCAQPCRQAYELEDENGRRISSKASPYLLSLKDICTTDLLPDLIKAGVCSFKIEGRMKRAEYAAGVVSIYRHYLDMVLEGRPVKKPDPEDLRKLMDLYNRGGFSGGYYYVEHSPEMMSMERPNHAGTPAFQVLKAGAAPLCRALEDLHAGDHIETGSDSAGRAREMTLRQDYAAGTRFTLPAGSLPGKVREGTVYSRVQAGTLLKDLEERYLKGSLKQKINGNFMLRKDEPAILDVSFGAAKVRCSGLAAELAQGRTIGEAEIRRQLEKTGDSPFVFENLTVDIEDGLFFPLGEINRMRREALERLKETYLEMFFRRCGADGTSGDVLGNAETGSRQEGPAQNGQPQLFVSVETKEQLAAVLKAPHVSRIYIDCLRYLDMASVQASAKNAAAMDLQTVKEAGKACFLMLPPIWRSRARKRFYEIFSADLIKQYDGLLVRCMDQIPDATDTGLELVSDTGLYTWNSRAVKAVADLGIRQQVMPAELNARELRQTAGLNAEPRQTAGPNGELRQTASLNRELRQAAGLNRELIVYGHQQVMITAQCLMADTAGCKHRPALLMLKDRMNMRFPVKTHCSICTNVIYNCLPLRLYDDLEACRKTGAGALRLQFTVEDGQRCADILKEAAAALEHKSLPSLTMNTRYTRGHFRRGVE